MNAPAPATTPSQVAKSESPLELTVHALPSVGGSGDAPFAAVNVGLGRFKMFMVLLLCAAPVIASYVAYYLVRPEGRRNYGELIDQRAMPVNLVGVPLIQAAEGMAPVANVATTATTAKPLSTLRDQWLLVSVAPAACDAACEKHLYVQRQMRESLGRERQRLDWVWLVSDDSSIRPELTKALSDPTAGGVVWRVKPQDLANWLVAAPGKRLQDHLFVVDPIGNWMMRFPADLDPARAKRDLERLLRASGAWDTAGRDSATASKLPLGGALPTSAASGAKP